MSLITNRIKKQPASDLINLDTYTTDNHLVVSKALHDKTYIGRAYSMSPIVGGGREFAQVLKSVFRAVADDSVIQVSTICAPDTDAPNIFKRGKDKGGKVVSELIARQVQLLNKAATIGWQPDVPILNRRELIITLATPVRTIDATTLSESLAQQTEFLNGLRGCGFSDARALPAGHLIGWYRKFANIFDPFSPVRLDELVELKYQVFSPSEEIDYRDSRIGKFNESTFCAAVTAKAFPEKPFQGMMNLVVGAPLNEGTSLEGGGQRILTPYILTTTIRVAHQRKEMDRIKNAIKSRLNNQTLPFRLGNEDPTAALDDLQYLEVSCAPDQDKIVFASMNAFLFGNTPAEAREAAASFKNSLSKLDFDASECRNDSMIRWAQSLPLNFAPGIADKLGGEGIMPSEAATCLLPIYADNTGNANTLPSSKFTGSIFVTRRGSAHYFDPYVNQGNPNGLVTAGSGKGKSVALQYLINNDLAEGTNVFLLDNGSSSKKYCRAVGGEFNEFSMDESHIPSLNPFTGLSESDFDEQQEGISALLLLMAYEDEVPQPGSRIAMTEAVRAAYSQRHDGAEIQTVIACLENIYQDLPSLDNLTEVQSAARNLVPRLKAFIESPSRGRFFRGKGTINPKSQFTVFELSALEGDEHLRRCVLFFVLNTLMTRIKTIDGRKKVYVDEAFDLLKDPGVANALEGIYLKGRKYKVSVWIIMQSLLKLVTIPAGSVIMKQSGWKLILGQSSEEIESIFKQDLLPTYAGDDYFKRLLKSVTTVKGVFSEILFLSESYYEVARLYLDRFTGALFSSEGDERDVVFSLMKQGVDPIEAVNRVLGDKKAINHDYIRDTLRILLKDGLTKADIQETIEELFA